MITLLTLLSALAVLLLVGALIYFLRRIVTGLESIGGAPDSYLAKLAFGLRAIETETGHLAPQVGQLNEGLGALAGRLGIVDGHLAATARALSGEFRGDSEEIGA